MNSFVSLAALLVDAGQRYLVPVVMAVVAALALVGILSKLTETKPKARRLLSWAGVERQRKAPRVSRKKAATAHMMELSLLTAAASVTGTQTHHYEMVVVAVAQADQGKAVALAPKAMLMAEMALARMAVWVQTAFHKLAVVAAAVLLFRVRVAAATVAAMVAQAYQTLFAPGA